MNDTTTPDVERLVGRPPASAAAELGRRVEDAVKAGITVEFFARDGDKRPAFGMRLCRGVLQVVDWRGRPVGTFASGAAAIGFGWSRVGRAGL